MWLRWGAVCAHKCRVPGSQKRLSDPLELESLGVDSHLTSVLGTKLGPSAKATSPQPSDCPSCPNNVPKKRLCERDSLSTAPQSSASVTSC